MNKFKVGDRVLAIDNVNQHDDYAPGTIVKVSNGIPNGYVIKFDDDGMELWNKGVGYDFVKPLSTNKIVITQSGPKTLARLYDGNTIIKSAEAKCSPSDTYDFATGANLCYDRLMRTEVLTKAAEPKTAQPTAQTAEEIKLYCVKDCEPGVWLTKGKTYTLTLKRGSDRGSITFDDGWTDTMFSLDLGRMYGEKLGGNFLFPLVSRPAKVGEWVYALATDGAGTKIKVGDIVKVTEVDSGGWATFKNPSYDTLRPEQYLVLDGYNPAEPKTCECCGQIIKGEQS